MLIVFEKNGELISPKNVINIELEQSLDIPADSLEVQFYYEQGFDDLQNVFLLEDDCINIKAAIQYNNVLFCGIVDEQRTIFSEKGDHIKVFARSKAALLIDNECMAQTYKNPSFAIMCERHAKPFGISIKRSDTENKSLASRGTLKLPKGCSHYKAIEKYCDEFLHTIPRIDHKGELCHDVFDCKGTLLFDNRYGIPFTSVTVVNKRCAVYSSIFVYDAAGFCAKVTDKESVISGIRRERYLNLLNSKTSTLSDADVIMSEAKKNAFSVIINVPKALINVPGMKAQVDNEYCRKEALAVYSVKYCENEKGQSTRLLLKRGDKDNVDS